MAHLDDVIVVKIWVEGDMSKFRPFACYVYGRWFFFQSWTYMTMYFGPYLTYCPSVSCKILICCSWHITLSRHIICSFIKTSESCWNLEGKTLNCQRNQPHCSAPRVQRMMAIYKLRCTDGGFEPQTWQAILLPDFITFFVLFDFANYLSNANSYHSEIFTLCFL